MAVPDLTNRVTSDTRTGSWGYALRLRYRPMPTGLDVATLALVSLTGNLMISNNPALQSVDGLGALQTVGGNTWATSNASLTSLAGLDSLTSVTGFLHVYSNAALCQDLAQALADHVTSASFASWSNDGVCS